ncbi:MAG: glutathione S-transferase N-terminal domain-containing protein [Pseudomonadota bacterium]
MLTSYGDTKVNWTLYASTSSPYTRKVRIVLSECDLSAHTQEVFVSPLVESEERNTLLALNPLAKIPTLITPEGESLYDSRVICEYLAARIGWNEAATDAPPHTWACQRRAALADGILDCAFNVVMERRRPAPARSAEWLARWQRNIERAAHALAEEMADAGNFDLSAIGTVCAVDYLDFRLPDLAAVPDTLRTWRQHHEGRKSVVSTMPTDG